MWDWQGDRVRTEVQPGLSSPLHPPITPETWPPQKKKVGWGCPREVLEGGGWLGPPSSCGPPMVPAEGGPKIVKLQSFWCRRRGSKILAVSLKHWKGRRWGRGGRGGYPPPPTVYGRSNTSLGCPQCLQHMRSPRQPVPAFAALGSNPPPVPLHTTNEWHLWRRGLIRGHAGSLARDPPPPPIRPLSIRRARLAGRLPHHGMRASHRCHAANDKHTNTRKRASRTKCNWVTQGNSKEPSECKLPRTWG